jgi:predicted CoA-substrate-specific enzyme activase
MALYAGIDIGSLSAETVIIDEKDEILTYNIFKTGANSVEAATASFNDALEKLKIKKEDIKYIVATGYGRVSVEFADQKITEITCHARGAYFLFNKTKMIIDIGGQDSKVIKLGDNGKVKDFTMNDKCAAGTGKFLEVMANTLSVDLDDMGDLSMNHDQEIAISSMCTVFAESEVVSLIAKGQNKPNIVNGLHKAISNRVASMASHIGPENEITMTGGVAKNIGVVKALEAKLNTNLNIPDEPQIIGALGAALLAKEKSQA